MHVHFHHRIYVPPHTHTFARKYLSRSQIHTHTPIHAHKLAHLAAYRGPTPTPSCVNTVSTWSMNANHVDAVVRGIAVVHEREPAFPHFQQSTKHSTCTVPSVSRHDMSATTHHRHTGFRH